MNPDTGASVLMMTLLGAGVGVTGPVGVLDGAGTVGEVAVGADVGAWPGVAAGSSGTAVDTGVTSVGTGVGVVIGTGGGVASGTGAGAGTGVASVPPASVDGISGGTA